MPEGRAALQLVDNDIIVRQANHETGWEDKVASDHDKSTDAGVVALEAMLVGRDKVTKVGEEVLRPLRVPELIWIVKSFDFGHVD